MTPAKETKFRNKATTLDGIDFASAKEARRYRDLKLLVRAGEIGEVTVHPVFPIDVCGSRICKYIGDFAYKLPDGTQVVEDVKSAHTRKLPVYRLKYKLMKAVHGITIREV